MKKLLAILLALTIVGGVAFAQITFSGYERAYTKVTETAGTFANRLRLNMSAKDADGNFGFWGRLQNADSAAPTVAYAYGYAKLGFVTVTAGKLGNYDYNLGTGVSDYALGNLSNDGYHYDTPFGTLVQAAPIAGLNVGVSYIPAARLSPSDFGANVKYSAEGLGDVIVESSIGDTLAGSRFSASVNFTGVKDLSAAVSFKRAANTTTSILGIVDYAMGDISFEVAPEYGINSKNIYVEGYARYAKDAFAVNLLAAYDKAGDTLGTDAADASYAFDTTTGLAKLTAATLAVPSTYFFGVEVYYTIGKTVLMTGFNYDEAKKWAVPFIVRANF